MLGGCGVWVCKPQCMSEFSVKLLLSFQLCGAPSISSCCGGNHLYPMGHLLDTRFSYALKHWFPWVEHEVSSQISCCVHSSLHELLADWITRLKGPEISPSDFKPVGKLMFWIIVSCWVPVFFSLFLSYKRFIVSLSKCLGHTAKRENE